VQYYDGLALQGLAHMLRGEHEEAAVFYTQVLAARLKDVEFNVEVLGLRALSKFEQKLYLEAVLDTSSVIDTVVRLLTLSAPHNPILYPLRCTEWSEKGLCASVGGLYTLICP
jgi:hypothetical protein